MPDLPPPIPSLIERSLLEKTCLGPKTTTCILALLPPASGPDAATLPPDATAALASLAEIREKHNERGGKLFPFFSIPAVNEGQGILKDALKLSDKDIELVAINARRGWWRRFEGEGYGIHSVESWVDAIRLGEGAKEKLPEGVIAEEEDEKVEEKIKVEEKERVVHEEL
ncbi:MAG: hypothetical protein LQ337_007712 [Flavoplaca oasis]|nr:MAG: hypothetical protein LQ337_007712 [Flavoplaca oasis]